MLASIEHDIVDCDENLGPDELAAFRMPPMEHLWENVSYVIMLTRGVWRDSHDLQSVS